MTRVAIVGGGLGGLAAAAFLHQAGVPAVVYEQARELREVGAGIMVPPNAARMLRRLGVLGPTQARDGVTDSLALAVDELLAVA